MQINKGLYYHMKMVAANLSLVFHTGTLTDLTPFCKKNMQTKHAHNCLVTQE